MTEPFTVAESLAATPVIPNPHPDGKPWAKCCTSLSDNQAACQCYMKKPEVGPSRHDAMMLADGRSYFSSINSLLAEKGRFFCVHRTTDDGFHRECAGWAAKITGNRP